MGRIGGSGTKRRVLQEATGGAGADLRIGHADVDGVRGRGDRSVIHDDGGGRPGTGVSRDLKCTVDQSRVQTNTADRYSRTRNKAGARHAEGCDTQR